MKRGESYVFKLADSKQQVDAAIGTNAAVRPSYINISGCTFWNSTTNQWVPGNVSANLTGSTTRTLTTITATSGQTTFTASGGYTVGYVDVYQNGIKLIGGGDDFTASNGNTVVFTQGATAGDVVEIVAYQLATVISTAGPKASGAIIVNSTTIAENYTFPSGHNGFSIGPVVINSGVVVNQASNQRWVIL